MKSKKNQAQGKGKGPASDNPSDLQIEGSGSASLGSVSSAAAAEIAGVAAAARTPAVAIDYRNVAAYKAYIAVKRSIDEGVVPLVFPEPAAAELCFPRWGELANVTDEAQFWYRRVRAILSYGVDDFNFAGGKYRVRALIPSHLHFSFTWNSD